MHGELNRIRHLCRRVSEWELAIVAALVPFLVFPTLNPYLTTAALLGVAMLWGIRWVGQGAVTRRTPLDGLMLILMLMVPVALWVSPLPQQSAEAACRVLAGVALYFALANSRVDEGLWRATLALAVLGGLVVALVGLVASDWNQDKIPFLEPVYALLPDLSHLLGPLASESDSTPGAFHPNFIGATLAILIPIAAAVMTTLQRRAIRRAAIAVLVVMLVVLLLTQSRLSMVALALASAAAVLRERPRWRRAALGLGVVLGLSILLIGFERVVDVLTPSVAAAGFGSWNSRVAVWQAALQALADFPFTGIGLAAFYPAVTYLYAVRVPPTWAFGHTHEVYLQVGMDFGVAGLIAFVVLIVQGLRLGWPARDETDPLRRLRIGVWTALLTYALFGVFDGVPMWTKPGFLIWVVLGWVMMGRRLSDRSSSRLA